MRKKEVTIGGKAIIVEEKKIKELKALIPKIEPAWNEITTGEVSQIVDRVGDQMKEIFPQLSAVELDDCYPSEIEEFVEAWIDVNFSGVKRLFGPLLSLANLGNARLESGLAERLEDLTIGKN